MRIEQLRQEPVVVAVPTRHPLALQESAWLTDLVGWPLVKLPRDRARLIDDLIRTVIEETPKDFTLPVNPVVQQATQYMTLLALVATEVGLALVPDSIRSLRSDGVRYLPLNDPCATSALTLATPVNPVNTAAEHLRRLLVSEFRDEG